DDARHRSCLVGSELDADTLVEARREQVIDDVKAFLAAGPVDAADVDQDLEEALWVVPQMLQDGDDLVAMDVDRELAHCDARGHEPAIEALSEICPQRVRALSHGPATVRSYRCGGSFAAAAARRRAGLLPSAGSPARTRLRARYGRSRAPPNRRSGS